jgi:hypothetical protein
MSASATTASSSSGQSPPAGRFIDLSLADLGQISSNGNVVSKIDEMFLAGEVGRSLITCP